MAENISEKVRDIIVEQLGVNPEQVTPEAKFIEDALVVTWQERCAPETRWKIAARVIR